MSKFEEILYLIRDSSTTHNQIIMEFLINTSVGYTKRESMRPVAPHHRL